MTKVKSLNHGTSSCSDVSMKKYASDDERIGFKAFFLLSMKYIFKSKEQMILLTGDTKNTATVVFYFTSTSSQLCWLFLMLMCCTSPDFLYI